VKFFVITVLFALLLSIFGKFNKLAYNVINPKMEITKMDKLLEFARIGLEEYFNDAIIPAENRLKVEDLENAHGIALINEAKGGLLFGGKGGSGIVLCRTKKHEWSGPIAVVTGGLSVGIQGGASQVDHIILLPTEYHVNHLITKGELELKGNAEGAFLKTGNDANVNIYVSMDKKILPPTISYTYGVKGLYGGVSLEATILSLRNDYNIEFYRAKNTTAEDICAGNTHIRKRNEDYDSIISILNSYHTHGSIFSTAKHINERIEEQHQE
jgi:lipid-binding SYLF domain-containing protein